MSVALGPVCTPCLSYGCCKEAWSCANNAACVAFLDCVFRRCPTNGSAVDPSCTQECFRANPNAVDDAARFDACITAKCEGDCNCDIPGLR